MDLRRRWGQVLPTANAPLPQASLPSLPDAADSPPPFASIGPTGRNMRRGDLRPPEVRRARASLSPSLYAPARESCEASVRFPFRDTLRAFPPAAWKQLCRHRGCPLSPRCRPSSSGSPRSASRSLLASSRILSLRAVPGPCGFRRNGVYPGSPPRRGFGDRFRPLSRSRERVQPSWIASRRKVFRSSSLSPRGTGSMSKRLRPFAAGFPRRA